MALDDQIGGICWPCTCCNRCGRMTDKFKCPVCQTELEKTATRCPECGSPVLPPPGSVGGGLAQPSAPPPPSALGGSSLTTGF